MSRPRDAAQGRAGSRTSARTISSAASLRRITVTHTSSFVFDPAEIEKAWRDGPALPSYVKSGIEDDHPDEMAATVYSVYGDSLIELFHPLQDDDVSYEVEDYDPEA